MTSHELESTTLCLGLVVFPEAGQEAAALTTLQAVEGLQLGDLQGHRIPAVAEVPRGEDKAFLANLEAMQFILHVAVVYAQTLPGEPTP